MPVMYGLHGVADIVKDACEGVEGPARAAALDPALAVVFEGAEGDEGVVAGAAAEDFGAGVADVTVAYKKRRRML